MAKVKGVQRIAFVNRENQIEKIALILNLLLLPVTRIAVPIFFMITGYYYDFNAEKKKKNRQIIHIIKLVIGANLFYFFYNGILEIIQKGSISLLY